MRHKKNSSLPCLCYNSLSWKPTKLYSTCPNYQHIPVWLVHCPFWLRCDKPCHTNCVHHKFNRAELSWVTSKTDNLWGGANAQLPQLQAGCGIVSRLARDDPQPLPQTNMFQLQNSWKGDQREEILKSLCVQLSVLQLLIGSLWFEV